LVVTYGSSLALDGVDFVAPAGSLVGILGPNGAGKSTFLRTAAGLVRPASGEVLLEGARISGLAAHEIARRGVCLVPEGRGILPTLSVSDNLRIALGDDSEAHDRVVDHFPVLGDRLSQQAGTLSGGEQQMLALARAVGGDARLLLVDEPSLGLAPRLVGMIEQTLRNLHERGRTVIWVEQYASRVLGAADIVYILGKGKVVWAGEPGELGSSKILTSSYLGGP
jgi:branched-chain amino acid transport system ATP-binding protein